MPQSVNTPTGKRRPGAQDPECAVARTIHAIGGKWKMLVRRTLLLDGPQRCNHLLGQVPGISPKELTRNLRDLEADGFVRRADRNGSAHIEYGLTAIGLDLMPAFEALLPVGERLRAMGERREA